jgi:hypothetical protein
VVATLLYFPVSMCVFGNHCFHVLAHVLLYQQSHADFDADGNGNIDMGEFKDGRTAHS